ncbi:MAG TPA: TetR/AcrR family transcriptional regulator [Streptosporangiaceae bacterium]|nr:TetR/AcrR family transcriptional regulator [Streptosporangiaceae bacterium]
MKRRPASNAWQWSRSAQTRRVLLEAAREEFAAHGFDGASVAGMVERAGSSVGSLYHHFGGKAELFVALWQDHTDAQEQRAVSAVAKARAAGEEDPLTLFIAGARAFLDGSWADRDVARLFLTGDGPPGFEVMRRGRAHEWIRQNAVLLGASADPVDRMTVTVLTTLIGEAAREIAAAGSRKQAATLTDAAITLIRRIDPVHTASDGPDT